MYLHSYSFKLDKLISGQIFNKHRHKAVHDFLTKIQAVLNLIKFDSPIFCEEMSGFCGTVRGYLITPYFSVFSILSVSYNLL